MDEIDRKILFFLCQNARFTDSEIAKAVGISRQRTAQRISGMVRRGIIYSFQVEHDDTVLGYAEAVFLIRAKHVDRITKHLCGSRYHIYVCEHYAKWNVLSYFVYRTVDELLAEAQRLADRHEIIEMEVLVTANSGVHDSPYYPMYPGYFAGLQVPAIRRSGNAFLSDFRAKKTPPGSVDYSLLEAITKNSRAPFAALAAEAGLSPKTARKRIRELIRQGVILGFHPGINQRSLGCAVYYICIKTRVLDSQEKKRFIDALYGSANVAYVRECFGGYNLIVDFYALKDDEVQEFTQDVLGKLQSDIIDIQPLLVTNEHKFARTIPKA